MAAADTFEALLDDMQAAALGVVAWQTVLQSLAGQLGVENAGLHKDYWQGGGWGYRISGDDKVFESYFRHCAGIHPLALRTLATPAGTVLTDPMIMPRAEFHRTEYYHDWAIGRGSSIYRSANAVAAVVGA